MYNVLENIMVYLSMIRNGTDKCYMCIYSIIDDEYEIKDRKMFFCGGEKIFVKICIRR